MHAYTYMHCIINIHTYQPQQVTILDLENI